MAEGVRSDARQVGLSDHLGPQSLGSLVVSITGFRREYELRFRSPVY